MAKKVNLDVMYNNLLSIYKKNRAVFLKAQRLETELEDAVCDDDDDAEYEVLEERTAAWVAFDKSIEPATKALSKLTKQELGELNQIAYEKLNKACENRSSDIDLIDSLQTKVMEFSWNAKDDVKPKEQEPSGPSM